MRQYRQLVESLPKKTVVFSFGRFQPPTDPHSSFACSGVPGYY